MPYSTFRGLVIFRYLNNRYNGTWCKYIMVSFTFIMLGLIKDEHIAYNSRYTICIRLKFHLHFFHVLEDF